MDSTEKGAGFNAHPETLERFPDGFVRIELGRALGADGGTTGEVVELRLAVGADLLCAQFGIGQVGGL